MLTSVTVSVSHGSLTMRHRSNASDITKRARHLVSQSAAPSNIAPPSSQASTASYTPSAPALAGTLLSNPCLASYNLDLLLAL